MDAKTLLNDNEFVSGLYIRYPQERADAIKSALSLAAAVEGPEEATPETDGKTEPPSLTRYINMTNHARRMERQRNAALRSLKAERERTNNALLAFKEERYRAGKMERYAGLLTIACEKVLTDDLLGGREMVELIDNALAERPHPFDAALASQEGSR